MATPNDIYNEITRIDNAKQGIAEAIEEKGVQVPDGTPIQDFPAKVRQIQTGSPNAVLYTPQELTPEQQGQARQNIGAGTYTKPGTGIPSSDLAEPVQTSLEKANTAVQPDALTPITDLIPEQATPQNQLADKNFVNSSVATNTANYISDNGQPFQSVADLEAYTGTLTNNDYAFVVGTDSAGNTTYTRYKYNATTQTWAEEYVLNNSSFTAEQWAAISSGITALLVQKLSELPTEIVTYVAQTLTDAQKQQARTNIGATAPEIFWAQYGATTKDEIDSALQSNKHVLCLFNNRVYSLMEIGTTRYYFGCNYGATGSYLNLNVSNNTWGQGSQGLQTVANRSQSIETDRASETKYPSVKAVFDSLGKWGVVSQTLRQVTNNTTHTFYYEIVDGSQVYGMIPKSFIDLVTGCKYDDYDGNIVFNEDTGYFELNGINNIAYDEMQRIYHLQTGTWIISRGTNDINGFAINYPVRTNFLNFPANTNQTFNISYIAWWSQTEVFRVGNNKNIGPLASQRIVVSYFIQAFYAARFVKKILPVLNVYGVDGSSTYRSFTVAFTQAYMLESIYLAQLKQPISFQDSPNLELSCVVYMVDNAVNTAAITITLHATAYARCQADTTEYEYNGQTYTGIIAYAAAKNITIASA